MFSTNNQYKMKILITGHRGFIGQNALKHFQSNHEIICWDWSKYRPILDSSYDWVMHFGAITSTTETNVEKVLNQNLDFSIWLIEQCNSLGINFQYSSSASIYGLVSTFREDALVDPRTPYAWSKYLFERYVKNKDWNIIHQGFRYFNVYGPGEDHKGSQASPYHQFTTQAKTYGRIKVFENSAHYHRDFVHVDRVIDTHKKFLNINQSGIWNIGTGTTRSFLDVATEIGKQYPSVIETIPMPDALKSSYQKYTCADLTHLNNTLNEKDNS
jgi:ADP-L-glycero-D-manno-heptose 6-epimerase